MRMIALAAVIVTAVIGMAAGALWLRPAAPPPPPPEQSPAPEQSIQDHDEASAITASNGLVARAGASLALRLKSGEVLTLTDRIRCGDVACPDELSQRFRYLGWDADKGGYRLKIRPSTIPEMLLPFAADDAVLEDARHADRAADAPVELPPLPQAAETDPSLNEWVADVVGERNQSEAPLLAADRGQAAREGAKLSLTLEGNRAFTLTDDLVCGQVPCPQQVLRSFDYAGRSPDSRYYVVEEHWNEASAAILVDGRSGAVTSLLGVPKFSPDGQRAVASVTDLEWSAPRRLEIWSLAGSQPGIEFALTAKDEDDTIYDVVGWPDADHIRLRRGPWSSDHRSPALLAHDQSGWHLDNADSAN